jgi:hypothetical protein
MKTLFKCTIWLFFCSSVLHGAGNKSFWNWTWLDPSWNELDTKILKGEAVILAVFLASLPVCAYIAGDLEVNVRIGRDRDDTRDVGIERCKIIFSRLAKDAGVDIPEGGVAEFLAREVAGACDLMAEKLPLNERPKIYSLRVVADKTQAIANREMDLSATTLYALQNLLREIEKRRALIEKAEQTDSSRDKANWLLRILYELEARTCPEQLLKAAHLPNISSAK